MSQQQHAGDTIDFKVGQRFKYNRATFEVTKVAPAMIEARSKAGSRWFWRRTLDKAGVHVIG